MFPSVNRADKDDVDRFLKGSTMWLRWVLRELAIGPLPVEWRYFVVNHYREVRDSIPERWTDAVIDMQPPFSFLTLLLYLLVQSFATWGSLAHKNLRCFSDLKGIIIYRIRMNL